MLEAIIDEALKVKASDIHLSVGLSPHVRAQGSLRILSLPQLTTADFDSILSQYINVQLRDELVRTGEIDCAITSLQGQRCRLNVYCHDGKHAMALRLLPNIPPNAEQLGIPEAVQKFAHLRQGLVLVTGATGSGKSTTLAALIESINITRAAHIITLESPIEYLYTSKQSLIHQREIGKDTLSFASGLRAALRQDPDVIMIGELRDAETIAIALTAAETGHFVLATLHTRDAASSINRILDVLPDKQQARTQLAECLEGVVCQQLLPQKEDTGRVPAFEVLITTDALRNLIREGRTHQLQSYIQTGKRYGMCTMKDAVAELKNAGIVK